jgi:uncharacterized membrane protein
VDSGSGYRSCSCAELVGLMVNYIRWRYGRWPVLVGITLTLW